MFPKVDAPPTPTFRGSAFSWVFAILGKRRITADLDVHISECVVNLGAPNRVKIENGHACYWFFYENENVGLTDALILPLRKCLSFNR